MRIMRLAVPIASTSAAALAAIAFAQTSTPVPYPEGYRHWTHVKSMVIEQGHPLFEAFGGIHHLYANDQAMRGYRSGMFPDGATIVFDLLEAKRNANAIVEGERKVVGVMRKDRRAYPQTGGWGFEGFKGNSKSERAVGTKAVEACFGCHAAQKDKDYVFGVYRN
jgi:hypothetical protein